MRNLFRFTLSLLSFYVKNNTFKFKKIDQIVNNEIIKKLKIKKLVKFRKKTHRVFNNEITNLINDKKLINLSIIDYL